MRRGSVERVRQAAEKDRRQRFTALLHHVYDVERLRAAYLALKRDAAAGVDGETWRHYGEDLEANLRDLAERLTESASAWRGSFVRKMEFSLRGHISRCKMCLGGVP